MYFVHPQIRLKDLGKVVRSLFKQADFESLMVRMRSYFPDRELIFTDMGRSAFKAVIERLGLGNSQILLPAYICDIFYPILKQYNIEPVFLDIDLDAFHIKLDEISRKITPKTKAVLVCHTYGLPMDIRKIRNVIKPRTSNPERPFIVEDCAHAFGAKLGNKFVGNMGDAAIFSLYKQIPACRGGLAILPQMPNTSQASLSSTRFSLRDFVSLLNSFPFFAFLFKKFGNSIAPKVIRKEKRSSPSRINRVSLNLFASFFEDFERTLPKRKELALFFQNELKKLGFSVQTPENNVFCYLSALVPKNFEEKRDEIVIKLRKYRVFATRIWHTPIIMNPDAQKYYKLNLADFPNTTEVANRIINFPLQNYYTRKDVEQIIDAVKKVLENL